METRREGDVTRILRAAEAGNAEAASELLPLVYAELRRLARARMAKTPPGNTLEPTALVHEAYVRLIGKDDPGLGRSRWHFFAAAAQAMRDILVEQARRKSRLKHGGARQRVHMDGIDAVAASLGSPIDDILALDEALQTLDHEQPRLVEVVRLRFFAGLTAKETAAALGVSVPTVERDWRFARTLLYTLLAGASSNASRGQDRDSVPTTES